MYFHNFKKIIFLSNVLIPRGINSGLCLSAGQARWYSCSALSVKVLQDLYFLYSMNDAAY